MATVLIANHSCCPMTLPRVGSLRPVKIDAGSTVRIPVEEWSERKKVKSVEYCLQAGYLEEVHGAQDV